MEIITKARLSRMGFSGQSASELCGPAAIAMLLTMSGRKLDIRGIVDAMKARHAFIPGIGTVLARVPRCFQAPLAYLPYVPTWLLVLMLRRGYGFAHSIKQSADSSGHIVFVHRYHAGKIYYYDPNQDTDAPVVLSVREWRQLSNRRAVCMKLAEEGCQ
ncbi:MAG TPA: hypothetical protein VFQ70_02625 [Candidatus Saccharimonadaceae bacterium]|nr:hypothetical protein [Candidatus Saccharimonadaceae bacterium]